MTLKSEILDLSRQNNIGDLTPWFDAQLNARIDSGAFAQEDTLRADMARILADLTAYREQNGIGAAVIGMSGGVDSALTAALFKAAGWRVVGHTMPIEQNPEETERGQEACIALGIEHQNIDLTPQFHSMVEGLTKLDPALSNGDEAGLRIRRGNMRARLRMITLYDQAHRYGGVVASTDNFSELAAGFWTLNGDVGDVAPIQSLLKSWEVPWMAREIGVPEKTWRATPTDGLGISAGDEAQLGVSYLQWDLMVLAMADALAANPNLSREELPQAMGFGEDAEGTRVLDCVAGRLGRTWYKRAGTFNLAHPREGRYDALAGIDRALFMPNLLK
ncbi:NH(3)-dependent NAD(+) synthetase [Falsiruegeria litorea R37]|uniref:NH(3)-dependent NAD(+) synthetase n=1 Tax=Falsiruegeria litorea R37 TaxID=1200284 RepID=A0A1Y5TVA8_9RHOB|nr:NAD(+) synthase [Falsiruegeria litorea]SLN73543.1 NH(3)-dependent NAD(+) synthetase [Falsiruegeria litorea R37]